MGAFRGELKTAVAGQTRTMLYGMLGMTVSVGGLVVAAARLGA